MLWHTCYVLLYNSVQHNTRKVLGVIMLLKKLFVSSNALLCCITVFCITLLCITVLRITVLCITVVCRNSNNLNNLAIEACRDPLCVRRPPSHNPDAAYPSGTETSPSFPLLHWTALRVRAS